MTWHLIQWNHDPPFACVVAACTLRPSHLCAPLRPLRFDGDRYKPTAENAEERREKDETTTTLPLDTGTLDEPVKCKNLMPPALTTSLSTDQAFDRWISGGIS